MKSFPKVVTSACGLAILLIAEPTNSLPAAEQTKKADDSKILELRKGAERGEASAQHRLGYMYHTGQGVWQDNAQAYFWYRKAAEQGYVDAQFNVGLMCQNGQGVPQDYAEALRWYRKAAEQGNTDAQFNLGVIYKNGQGVPRDYAEAHVWYNLAASRTSGSWQKIAAYERDEIAQKMTPQQITEAQRRAREWKPKSGADKGGKPVK